MFKTILLAILLQTLSYGAEFYNYGFHFHGQFCGANIPNVQASSVKEEFKLLEKIKAIDPIDEACKEHDLCYLLNGDKKTCDQELVLNIDKIHDKLENTACVRLSKFIRYYFTVKNDNFVKVLESDKSVRRKIVDVHSSSFRNMIDTASMSSVMMMNYAFDKPTGYLFDYKENSQRRKEVLQIFPPRYKACTVSK